MELFKDKLSMFFVDDNSFIYSSETNQKLLREIIINHKVFLFYTHSIKQMGFTPTQISELIIFLLKNTLLITTTGITGRQAWYLMRTIHYLMRSLT